MLASYGHVRRRCSATRVLLSRPPSLHLSQALRAFRSAGKRLLFVTNNSSKSRAQYVDKFRGLGLEVAAEEVGMRGDRVH